MKTKENIAAEAYQVIGALADSAGLFESPEVQRALDYFSGIANGAADRQDPDQKEILPWILDRENCREI